MRTRLQRPPALAAAGAVLLLALAVAGCGGGSSKSSSGETTSSTPAATTTTSSTTSTNTSGKNYDPATTILKAAGLQVCQQSQASATLIVQEGFTGARTFLAAPDCSTKGPRTTIVAATFSTRDAVAKGTKAIQKLYPKSVVTSYKTIVVSVSGQNAQEISDKITKELKGPTTHGG